MLCMHTWLRGKFVKHVALKTQTVEPSPATPNIHLVCDNVEYPMPPSCCVLRGIRQPRLSFEYCPKGGPTVFARVADTTIYT